MTDDRNGTEVDSIVADTYRALSDEKVPEHLDRAVLEMANSVPPRRNTLLAGWMKPVAWAATIGLSVAIVLELTELPDASQNELLAPAADVSAAVEQREQTQSIEVPRLESKRGAESYSASAPAAAQSVEKAYSRERRNESTALLETMDDAISSDDSRCSATARRSADQWRACIENLRDAGDDQAADEERRAFAEQFPDEFAKFEANK